MKKFCCAVLLLMVCFVGCGFTLKGGVTYTVESARKEAFTDVQYKLPKEIIEANKVDPNFEENKKAQDLDKKVIGDRHITFFSSGLYCVTYLDDFYHSFYYSKSGKLLAVEKRKSLSVPTITYKYDTKGNLIIIDLHVKADESYIFEPDGKLKAHWIKNKCYNSEGKKIGERY